MAENPLGYEKISKLLKNFAVPSIVASLVGSIYNIVDQIFIGQGVGYLGNAATNVAYPFSTICLAIALLVGIGSASRVSLCLGRKEPKAAAKAAGNGIVLMGIFGIIYLLVGETFLSLLLKAFGATTDVFPYAYLSFHGVGKWCAVAFFQLFYRNRKIVKRCSVGINKADLFLDSAYPAAPASFRNYGSIASGAYC